MRVVRSVMAVRRSDGGGEEWLWGARRDASRVVRWDGCEEAEEGWLGEG